MTQAPTPPEAQPEAHSAKRTNWVAISVAALGGVVVLGTVGVAALSGVIAANQASSSTAQEYVVPANGITQLDVENAATDLRVQCGTNTDEFVLSVPAGSRAWTFEHSGDTLDIEPERNWLSWFPFVGGSSLRGHTEITLTMPASACDGTQPISASFDVGAGQIDVDGEFDELDLLVGAGTARVTGAAHTVIADIAVGEGDLNLRDVHTAELTVAAGDLTGRFTGTAPTQIEIEVAVGDATMWVPDGRYAVTSEVSVGDFDNGVVTDQSATAHQIFAEVAAGSLSLQPLSAE